MPSELLAASPVGEGLIGAEPGTRRQGRAAISTRGLERPCFRTGHVPGTALTAPTFGPSPSWGSLRAARAAKGTAEGRATRRGRACTLAHETAETERNRHQMRSTVGHGATARIALSHSCTNSFRKTSITLGSSIRENMNP